MTVTRAEYDVMDPIDQWNDAVTRKVEADADLVALLPNMMAAIKNRGRTRIHVEHLTNAGWLAGIITRINPHQRAQSKGFNVSIVPADLTVYGWWRAQYDQIRFIREGDQP